MAVVELGADPFPWVPVDPWVAVGALVLDRLLADPWSWYHPVQAMGQIITWGQGWILSTCRHPWQQRWGGGILTLVLVLGSWGYGAAWITLMTWIHPGLGMLTHIVLLASCLGARGLRLAAAAVLPDLEQGDLEGARGRLARIVGRDTDRLEQTEICRALVETVAENTPDGATAPLFYGILGGAPLALAYKAISTLDSMVGYRRAPYTYLGTIPARLEDGLTWLPCRLTVLTLALWDRDPIGFWRRCGEDARQDPSPNSGWSEAAFAWRLGVRLGGINTYQGISKPKPHLGLPQRDLSPGVVRDSLRWLRRVMGVWILAIVLGYGLWLGLGGGS